MNRQEQKAKGIIGFTVIETWQGMITRSELPVYRTHAIALQEALREIEHRMLNDHPDGLDEEDKEIYKEAQAQLVNGVTMVTLPELGNGSYDIYIRPVWRSTL